jgi:C-terminal processing protease CtpA/Prc
VVRTADPETTEPQKVPTPRGLDNAVAFTRLLGYVRHFHPSDEAAATDWAGFAIRGMRAVEQAGDANALADVLQQLFAPVAPTVRVFLTGQVPPLPPELARPPREEAPSVTWWSHYGYGPSGGRVYRCDRVTRAVPAGAWPADLPQPADVFTAELPGGVSCLVPLALWTDAQGTLPHVAGGAQASASQPTASVHTPADRATRLAIVALAWNIPQHFYPYFDVVETDWLAALRTAVTRAATDADGAQFLRTLQWLTAQLHDGHAGVGWHNAPPQKAPPLCLRWVGDQLAVTQVAPGSAGGLRPGDVILGIDGRSAAEALAAEEELVSAATPHWRRLAAIWNVLAGPEGSQIALKVRSPNGHTRLVRLSRTEPTPRLERRDTPALAEVRPGIVYMDLDRVTEDQFNAALDQLPAAKGLILDLRGYPEFTNVWVSHLIDEPIASPQFHVPTPRRPDREGMTFHFANWSVDPEAPRFRGKVAFLTDARAMSRPEVWAGMVEHYRLAEIVGETTAGTNGEVNWSRLPAGYDLTWTGMKLLKHDGSQHHGVGIHPTVPVSPTLRGIAEGRDEILERAIEVVSP